MIAHEARGVVEGTRGKKHSNRTGRARTAGVVPPPKARDPQPSQHPRDPHPEQPPHARGIRPAETAERARVEVDHRLLVLDVPKNARGRLPTPALGLGAGPNAHPRAMIDVVHESTHAIGVSVDVAGRDEVSGVLVPYKVGYAPGGAADDWYAARHALQDDEAEGFYRLFVFLAMMQKLIRKGEGGGKRSGDIS